MDLFLVVVLLLALLAPILSLILLKKSKQHKTEIEALNHQKIALSNELRKVRISRSFLPKLTR